MHRMEVLKLKSLSGMAKASGITLCLAGVLTMALYTGPSLDPINSKGVFVGRGSEKAHVSNGLWIMGVFLMLVACVAWSLWIVFQVCLIIICNRFT